MVGREGDATAVRSPEDRTDGFADLLAAAQAGEPQALSQLWSDFSTGVAAFVRARGAVDVDEITNDTFLAVFSCLADFTGDARGFRALMFTIARRRVVDEQRRRRARVSSTTWWPFEVRGAPEGVAGPESPESPEALTIARESSQIALACINRLTDDQRDVVLLRLVADLSIEEVAAILGKTAGSVKSLQRRGLDTVRRRWPTEHESLLPDRLHARGKPVPEGPDS